MLWPQYTTPTDITVTMTLIAQTPTALSSVHVIWDTLEMELFVKVLMHNNFICNPYIFLLWLNVQINDRQFFSFRLTRRERM